MREREGEGDGGERYRKIEPSSFFSSFFFGGGEGGRSIFNYQRHTQRKADAARHYITDAGTYFNFKELILDIHTASYLGEKQFVKLQV